MKPYASYIAPSPSPLPPSGGEDKGEGGKSDADDHQAFKKYSINEPGDDFLLYRKL
jgi:hypothetical protein